MPPHSTNSRLHVQQFATPSPGYPQQYTGSLDDYLSSTASHGKENRHRNSSPASVNNSRASAYQRTHNVFKDDTQHSPLDSSSSAVNASLSFTEQRLRSALVEKQQLLEEVSRCKKRERQLLTEQKRSARQLEELKAHAARTDEVCKEMMGARRSAREALSDMAQQNSRLITALLDKKSQIQQLQQEHTQAVMAAQEEVLRLRQQVDEANLAASEATTRLQALQVTPTLCDSGCQAGNTTECTSSSGVQTDGMLLEGWVNERIRDAVQAAVADAVQEAIQHAQMMWEEERHCLTCEIMELKGQLDAVQQLEHAPSGSPGDRRGSAAVENTDAGAGAGASASQYVNHHANTAGEQTEKDPEKDAKEGSMDIVGLQEQVVALQRDREHLLEQLQRYRELAESAEAQNRAVELREEAEAHKQAGNNAFHQQQYASAITHYDRALALNLPDKRLNAVLHCNKAAALHEQGMYIDAVIECCMAEACDSEYSRVFQRRSEAYQALGDYAAALHDMQKVAKSVRSSDMDRKMAQLERRARHQGPLNYYAVLNVPSNASSADIKTAYRSMALRYHPDKSTNPTLEPACATVFKLAAEAHATLSDVDKRAAFDALQLRRKLAKYR